MRTVHICLFFLLTASDVRRFQVSLDELEAKQ